MITGIDIVKTQILVADGANLFDERVSMPQQEEIQTLGYAIQCRITTEDPSMTLCQIQVLLSLIDLVVVLVYV